MTQGAVTIDAQGKSLGRLASAIAVLLRGKDQKHWNPSVLPNRRVRVLHHKSLALSQKKLRSSIRRTTSGYPGKVKRTTLGERMAKDPKKVLVATVKNMLPANTHRQHLLSLIDFA